MPAPSAEPAPELCDILVVGCGPVGAFAAALLARGGGGGGGSGAGAGAGAAPLRVLCLERDASVYAAPRAVHVDDAAVRVAGLVRPRLAAWLDGHVLRTPIEIRSGPPPEPEHDGAAVPRRGVAGPRGGVALLGPSAPIHNSAAGYSDMSFFHQPTFEARLRNEAFAPNSLGGDDTTTLESGGGFAAATLMQHCEVVGIRVVDAAGSDAVAQGTAQPGDAAADTSAAAGGRAARVIVTALDSTPGEPPRRRTFRARLVLAADGGASFVRKSLGVRYEGTSYRDEPWLVVDVATSDAAVCQRWQFFNFICDPQRTFVHAPLPGASGMRRFEFLLARGEDAAAMVRPACVAQLLASIGVPPARVRVVRAIVYTFHARQASRWRAGLGGRVLLLGDAAHCMPPFRGQGLCAGLRDAANACWKTAEAVRLLRCAEAAAAADADAAVAGAPRVAAPAAPSAVALLGLADTLLDSYQLERQAHLVRVVALAVRLGFLIMMQDSPLTWARNAVLIALDRFPPTTAIAMRPFATPGGFDSGLFDFHDASGRRASARLSELNCKADGLGVQEGWVKRDRAAGAPLPNLPAYVLRVPRPVSSGAGPGVHGLDGEGAAAGAAATARPSGPVFVAAAEDGAEAEVRRVLLDEALWLACEAAQAHAQGTTAATGGACDRDARPCWVVLMSTGASALGAATHPAAALPTALLATLATGGVYGPRCVFVQLLPAVGSPTRLARHAAWLARLRPLGEGDSGSGANWTSSGGEGSTEPWLPFAHSAVGDAEASLGAWMEGMGASVVVVRPDRFVFGAYSAQEWPRAAERLTTIYGQRLRARPMYPLALRLRWAAALVALVLVAALAWRFLAPLLVPALSAGEL